MIDSLLLTLHELTDDRQTDDGGSERHRVNIARMRGYGGSKEATINEGICKNDRQGLGANRGCVAGS